MGLPPTFFYKFFKENIFFLVEHTIYNPEPYSKRNSVIVIGEKRFDLNKGLRLSKLEELYFLNNDAELKEYGNNILKCILSDEIRISENYHKLGEELEFAEFVLYNLLKKGNPIKKDRKVINFQEKDTCLIENLFHHNCFVWKEKIYSLDKKGMFSVKVDNKNYSIGENLNIDLEELEKTYLKKIEGKVYSQLTNGKGSLLSKVEKLKEKKELVDLIRRKEFFDPKKNIGFKISDNGFFITTKVDPYILFEPRNNKHYRFNEALIGIKLLKNGKNIRWKEPVVINPYIHPSLSSTISKPYQKICNGYFDYNKATQGKSLEDSIGTLLTEARRMILKGYYGISGAWHNLTEAQFQSLEVKEYDPREVTNKEFTDEHA